LEVEESLVEGTIVATSLEVATTTTPPKYATTTIHKEVVATTYKAGEIVELQP